MRNILNLSKPSSASSSSFFALCSSWFNLNTPFVQDDHLFRIISPTNKAQRRESNLFAMIIEELECNLVASATVLRCSLYTWKG